MGSETKQALVCDAGGVAWSLIDMAQWWEELFLKNNVWTTKEQFGAAKKIALKVAWEPFERGTINTGEFQILFQRILGLTALSALDFLDWYTHIMKEVNMSLIECLWEMRDRGIVLALLSNLDEERHHHTRRKHAREYEIVTAPFHYLFFSYQIGSRKPEPEIYRHVFKEISVLPQNAYFIDDWLPNVEGMATVIHDMPRENMHLYHADRHEDAVAFFRRHGLIA